MKDKIRYYNDVERVIKCIPNIDKLRGSKVLITGATGMVCSPLVDILIYLNQRFGMQIELFLAGRSRRRMSDRFEDLVEGKDYSFIKYDATKDEELCLEVDYIIHGASNASPNIYSLEPVETLLGNIIGTNSMLRLATQNNTKRLLYISSSEVYGKIESELPYLESDYGFVNILDPRSCYPNAKRTAETLCVAYSVEYDIDVVIARLGHIYGPSITQSDMRASAQFSRNASRGMDIVMKSPGKQLRSYCYTLDCASAILTILINGENRNAYNISNCDSIVSIYDMAKELAGAANVGIRFADASEFERKGYNLMDNSSLDSGKLEKLGWKACFDLKEGVRRTIEHLQIIND